MAHKYGTGTIPKRYINSLVPHWKQPDTYRFNHEDCPAGVDTKQRLYITIPHDKKHLRLAYCHNCGSHAVVNARADSYTGSCSKFSDKSYEVYLYDTQNVRGLHRRGDSLSLDNYEHDPDNFPSVAKALLAKAHLTREMIKDNLICYDYKSDRLVYPYFSTAGALLSAQFRSLADYGKGPKYYTVTKDITSSDKTDVIVASKLGRSRLLVITEDLLSAIRVVHDGGFDALPLAGTHIRTETLFRHALEYDGILIWLDNDSEIIINKAKDMCDTLTALGKCKVHMYYETDSPKEPKHLTSSELKATLQEIEDGV